MYCLRDLKVWTSISVCFVTLETCMQFTVVISTNNAKAFSAP